MRKDYFDGIEEYVDKLSPKEKEWLNRFLEETVVTNFQHKGSLLYKSKKAKREFYNSNNARNRCMQTKAAAMGMLLSTEQLPSLDQLLNSEAQVDNNSVEDAMITAMELKSSGIIEEELIEAELNLLAREETLKEILKFEKAKLSKRNKKSRNSR